MNAPVPGLALADGARAALLRSLGAPGRALLRDPSLRVALYGAVGVASSLLLTCAAPAHVFAVAPLVLGVPHLLADVRYLVVRPGLHRRVALVLAAGLPLLVAAFTASLAAGLVAPVLVAAVARGAPARRAVVALAAAAGVALAVAFPNGSLLAMAHGHNLVGAVFVLAVFSRRRALEAAPIGLFLAVAVAMGLGGFDAALLRPFALIAPGSAEPYDVTVARMAPLADPVLAARLVALFVFAQSVHYVTWLRLVPELARGRRGVRSFSSSARALLRDLGPWLIGGAGCALAGLAAVATRSLADAREAYLLLAAFHGPLELSALALVLVEGRRALAPRSC